MPKNNNLSGNLFTKKALTIKETPLSASIGEWLDLHRIFNERINAGKVKVVKSYFNKTLNKWIDYPPFWMQLAEEGTPDRRAMLPHPSGFGVVIVYIEVKQLGKKPTDVQLKMHDKLRKIGAIVISVDSFDDFLTQFKAAKDSI